MTSFTAVEPVLVAPPVSKRSLPLREPTHSEYLTRLAICEIIAIGAFVGAWLCWGAHIKIGAFFFVLIAAFFGYLGFSTYGRKAQCVYCDNDLGETSQSELGQKMRCNKCGEYSQVAGDKTVALDPTAVAHEPIFESALFKEASIPLACAICGASPTRFDTVSATRSNKGAAAAILAGTALVGRPAVYYSREKASIQVPYCDQHRDGVTLRFHAGKPSLLWRSYRMLRCYLAANRGKQSF